MRTLICIFIAILLLQFPMTGQQQATLAEKLGYPADAKLLIIHCDDMGMSHSTNMACMKAIEKNVVNSGSIMVPCPWFTEMAEYLKNHPQFDAGIHLTFTSEWRYYKWGGVLPACEISSLLDSSGHFQSDNRILAQKANTGEILKEIRAQIDRAIAYGIQPTHIDNHTGSLLMKPDLLKEVLKISAEYNLPLTIPMNLVKRMAPALESEIPHNIVVVDHYYSMYGQIASGDWKTTYAKMISDIKPGLNEMVFHLSYDNDEMQAIATSHPEFGSEWRQKDMEFVMSDDFQQMLKDASVTLVTWRQIRDVTQR